MARFTTSAVFGLIFAVIFLGFIGIYIAKNFGLAQNLLSGGLGLLDINGSKFDISVRDFKYESTEGAWIANLESDMGSIESMFCDSEHCYIGRIKGTIEKISKTDGSPLWKTNSGENNPAPLGVYDGLDRNNRNIPYSIGCDSTHCYVGIGDCEPSLAKIDKVTKEIIWVTGSGNGNFNVCKEVASGIECPDGEDVCYLINADRRFTGNFEYQRDAGYIVPFSKSDGSKYPEVPVMHDNSEVEIRENANSVDMHCDNDGSHYCFIAVNQEDQERMGGTTVSAVAGFFTRMYVTLDGSNPYHNTVDICNVEIDGSKPLEFFCPVYDNRFGPNDYYRSNKIKSVDCDDGSVSSGHCYVLIVGMECADDRGVGANTRCDEGNGNSMIRSYVVRLRKADLKADMVFPLEPPISKVAQDLECDETECLITEGSNIIKVVHSGPRQDLNSRITHDAAGPIKHLSCGEENCFASMPIASGRDISPVLVRVSRDRII